MVLVLLHVSSLGREGLFGVCFLAYCTGVFVSPLSHPFIGGCFVFPELVFRGNTPPQDIPLPVAIPLPRIYGAFSVQFLFN